MSIVVRGRRNEWAFTFDGDPRYLQEWQADGLDVSRLEHTVPQLVVTLGLTRLWCAVQSAVGGV